MANEVNAFKEAKEVLNDLENKILNSDEYEDLKNQSAVISEKIERMNEPLVEAKNEVAKCHLNLMEYAIKNEKFDTSDYKVKFRERKEINRGKLFEIVNNIKEFMGLVTITQIALKGYAKTHTDKKDELAACVETIEKTPTSVVLKD